jgi:hypothetical protein
MRCPACASSPNATPAPAKRSLAQIQGLAAYDDGSALDRARNMGAGCVAVALLNLLLIIALGR